MSEMQPGTEAPQTPVPPEAEKAGGMEEKQQRMWATVCHLCGFAGFIVPWVGNIVGPLVIWLLKREDAEFIDWHGKEAVNFQISITIYAVAAIILVFVVIGFLILPAVAIFDIVCIIMAAVKANNGERWRYPLCIRFIK